MMLLPALLIGAQIGPQPFMTVADRIPNYNLEKTCQMTQDIAVVQDKSACIADERAAREQLQKEWSSFAGSDRNTCTGLAGTGGQPPTYTELLTCLEMTRDARQLARGEQTGRVKAGTPY